MPFEIKEQQEGKKPFKFSRRYVATGFLFLFAGVALGTVYFSYVRTGARKPEARIETSLRQAGEVSGTTTDAGNSRQALKKAEEKTVQNPITPAKPQLPLPPPPAAIKASVKTAPVNICAQAKTESSAAEEKAQKDFAAATAESKKTYDEEQKGIAAELSATQTERNQAINNYLTAIALATSKYNSSQGTYEAYQQEQQAALAIYTQLITDLSTRDADIQKRKKASQDKYDAAVSSAQSTLDQALASSKSQYEAKTSGKNCANN